MAAIERVMAEEARAELSGLVALLRDAVASGASVGFLDPLGLDEAEAYWRGAIADVEREACSLAGTLDASVFFYKSLDGGSVSL